MTRWLPGIVSHDGVWARALGIAPDHGHIAPRRPECEFPQEPLRVCIFVPNQNRGASMMSVPQGGGKEGERQERMTVEERRKDEVVWRPKDESGRRRRPKGRNLGEALGAAAELRLPAIGCGSRSERIGVGKSERRNRGEDGILLDGGFFRRDGVSGIGGSRRRGAARIDDPVSRMALKIRVRRCGLVGPSGRLKPVL